MYALLRAAILCGCLVSEPAAQAPQGTPPLRVGGNIRPPDKVHDVVAVYPDDARRAGIGGKVIFELSVGADGTVTDVQLLRGVPRLNDAAIDAVKQWRFKPTLRNGVAVPVIVAYTVFFPPPGWSGERPDGEPSPSEDPYFVTSERVGPFSVGMTVPELKRAAPGWQVTPVPTRTARGLATNFHIAPERGGLPMLVTHVENAHVVRIEVRSNRFRTLEGLGIGTSLSELRQFDPRLRVEKCDTGACAVLAWAGYTFELDASAATASDLAQVIDTARVTRILVAKRAMRAPGMG